MAAVLVLNTPDDGRLRSKHVEWPCRNKTCTVLHQVGVSFDLYYDARKHKIKILYQAFTYSFGILWRHLHWHYLLDFRSNELRLSYNLEKEGADLPFMSALRYQ